MDRLDFSNLAEAFATVDASVRALEEKIGERDASGATAIIHLLTDAFREARSLIRSMAMSSDPQDARMGAELIRPGWMKDAGPDAIMSELRNAVAIEEIGLHLRESKIPIARSAEVKRLKEEIAKIRKDLTRTARSVRSFMIKNWASYWSDAEDYEFRVYL